MFAEHSRREFFRLTCAAGAAGSGLFAAQAPGAPQPIRPLDRRSAVALVRGDDRRRNIHDVLVAIDDQIRPVLQRKEYVVIKPNLVSTTNQLAATHADALRGILDYLAPRFRGPVIIAESSAGETRNGFEHFYYDRVVVEHRSQKVSLVDLNEEARYETIPLVDFDLHPAPVRLAARLLDPRAFVICSAMPKTHDTVVATMAVKNMVLGAPLHSAPKETPKWSDKRRYHVGLRQTHWNMLLTVQKMQPHWGAAVIDGFEGMEGEGPSSGTAVASRLAIASTDFVAADRIGVETMGINPNWVGYLTYCGQTGLGQYDLSRIDLRGESVAAVRKSYRLHRDIDRQLQWMGPLKELPPRTG